MDYFARVKEILAEQLGIDEGKSSWRVPLLTILAPIPWTWSS